MFCPFTVSTSKITQLDEVHKLLGELLKSAMLKVSHSETKKAKLLEKLIGMKFNVEYIKLAASEAQDYVTHGKFKL
jgi:hypothetical protein